MKESKWWGWGDPNTNFDIGAKPGVLRYLDERFGVIELKAARSFDLRSVKAPSSRLPENLLSALAAIVGTEHCRHDRSTRVRYALGKSYPDLVKMRSGMLDEAPDAVIFPSDENEIRKIFELCRRHKIALIPFGGGTSVVGGVNAYRGGFPYLLTLVTTRMDRLLEVDEPSMTALIEAGASGPELEAALKARGFSLGHFPQSFEFSTLGGWIAARSSGQNCLGYGNIEQMTVSINVLTPAGELRTIESPNHATGPDLKQLLIGSEGVCGVILSARMRIHRTPEAQAYFMAAAPSFAVAARLAKEIAQSRTNAALVRVSDEEESVGMLSFSDTGSLSSRVGRSYLKLRGLDPKGKLSLILAGFEGTKSENARGVSEIRRLLSREGCVFLGFGAGRHWLKERFRLPYLRDEFLDQGLFIETLETATPWSRLPALYEDVRRSVQIPFSRAALPCSVFTHISHLYPDGASLYFTIIGKAGEGDPVALWKAMKQEAGEAIRRNHAPISHHHGVGMDHRAFLHWNTLEQEIVKNLKRTLDPEGIMNPGKLLP